MRGSYIFVHGLTIAWLRYHIINLFYTNLSMCHNIYNISIQYGYIASSPDLPPSFAILHAEKCFSACNIEKLGTGLGMRLPKRCNSYLFYCNSHAKHNQCSERIWLSGNVAKNFISYACHNNTNTIRLCYTYFKVISCTMQLLCTFRLLLL